jgi:glutamate synthase domain-containing protein 2
MDAHSPARFRDINSLEDLKRRLKEIRAITGGAPIGVKFAAGDVEADTAAALEAGADWITVDGLGGGTGAAPVHVKDHVGVPGFVGLYRARKFLEDHGVDDVQLIATGGFRTPDEMAKALALGADAVSIGTAALLAMAADAPLYADEYHRLGVEPGDGAIWHTGLDPTGIATQEPELEARLDLATAAERVFNFVQAMTMEIQILARACGKADVHDLEPEDMRALTLEASMITGIPLAGMDTALTPDAIAERVVALLGKDFLSRR